MWDPLYICLFILTDLALREILQSGLFLHRTYVHFLTNAKRLLLLRFYFCADVPPFCTVLF